MYLIISEDGELTKTNKIDEVMKEEWEEGLIDIIDMKTEKLYYEGAWEEIKKR